MEVETPRPVWLTEEDVEYLGGQRSAEARAYLRSKWDAAPADAMEAANQAVPWECHHAEAVLRALGMPDA